LAKIPTVDAYDGSVQKHIFGRVTAKETVALAFQVGGQTVASQADEEAPIACDGWIERLDLDPFVLAHATHL